MLCRVVVLDVYDRMSLRRLKCRLASLVTLGDVFYLVFLAWDEVLSPPISGYASVNIMSGVYFVSLYHDARGCVCFLVVCDSHV